MDRAEVMERIAPLQVGDEIQSWLEDLGAEFHLDYRNPEHPDRRNMIFLLGGVEITILPKGAGK